MSHPTSNASADAPTHRAIPHYRHAIPCLAYSDAPAGIRWLVDTFGADARHVYDGPDGTVAHAELWFGDGCVMMGSLRDNGMPPHAPGSVTVYIVVPTAAEVDALHNRAVAAGARIVVSLRDTDYGSRDFVCLDPEGNGWSFGTYAPA
jgi:uncharacterized glyoxalase superfamily protein PhnB